MRNLVGYVVERCTVNLPSVSKVVRFTCLEVWDLRRSKVYRIRDLSRQRRKPRGLGIADGLKGNLSSLLVDELQVAMRRSSLLSLYSVSVLRMSDSL